MPSDPLVSVLTPSYNQGRWLVDNLRSVERQSYLNIEHIVIDGGSKDETLDVLSASGPHVTWRSGADHGQSDAIQRAFDLSRGDIIGWLNSDDAYFSSRSIEWAVEAFNADPSIGLVYGHALRVGASGRVMYVLWVPPATKQLLRLGHNPIRQPATFVRRSAIGRRFFVDPRFDYMMDRELWIHLSTKTQFQRLDRILAVDRHHAGRKSVTRRDIRATDAALLPKGFEIQQSGTARLARQGIAMSLRIAGLAKVSEAATGSDTLQLETPPTVAIAIHQVTQLQRWFPIRG